MPNIDTVQSLINWKPPVRKSIIEQGVLLPETQLILFGPSKSWKSILANHTAFCIANGDNWLGFKTSKCVVFRYQIELPRAVDRRRVIKYSTGAEGRLYDSKPKNLYFKTNTYIKMDSTFGIASLDKDIQEILNRHPNEHLVVIIDPLYKIMSGRITDEYDVRKLTDNLDILKNKYALTWIIVHHTRLTRILQDGSEVDLGAEDMLGSAVLTWWCDTAVKLKVLNPHSGRDKIRLTFEIPRHAEDVLPIIDFKWDRSNLQLNITKREIPKDIIGEDETAIVSVRQ